MVIVHLATRGNIEAIEFVICKRLDLIVTMLRIVHVSTSVWWQSRIDILTIIIVLNWAKRRIHFKRFVRNLCLYDTFIPLVKFWDWTISAYWDLFIGSWVFSGCLSNLLNVSLYYVIFPLSSIIIGPKLTPAFTCLVNKLRVYSTQIFYAFFIQVLCKVIDIFCRNLTSDAYTCCNGFIC